MDGTVSVNNDSSNTKKYVNGKTPANATGRATGGGASGSVAILGNSAISGSGTSGAGGAGTSYSGGCGGGRSSRISEKSYRKSTSRKLPEQVVVVL